MVRKTRLADDDDDDVEPDEDSEAELAAADKRRPKITRPAYSSFKTTTEKPDVPAENESDKKVEQPAAAAAADKPAAAMGNAPAAPPVDTPRSFSEPAPPTPPKVSTMPSFLVAPERESSRYQAYQGRQWGGIKGGPSSKGAPVKSAAGSGKGGSGSGAGQQWQQEQAFVKSPIARGKSMFRPHRPQVPMVVSPVPFADLYVPSSAQRNGERRQEEQQETYSRYQGSNFAQQVNSIRQKEYEQPAAPAYEQQSAQPLEAPVAVKPIARGSRPRSSKSKYVGDQYSQQRTVAQQLSPPSSRPLARAEVSEAAPQTVASGGGGSGGYAFTLDDCPYGMRISMCRKRAAERFRS